MSGRSSDTKAFVRELVSALCLGAAAAFVMPATAMGRIDEALITFLSILAGAALPGMALTAAAPRPPTDSAVEAGKLGSQLENQVRFWFSFILIGGLAVVGVLAGRALNWTLETPRPAFVPDFVPEGGAWLVFVAATLTILAAIRMRHVVGAVLDLVRLGTSSHAAQALDRRRAIQETVAEQLRTLPPRQGRGEEIPHRERH